MRAVDTNVLVRLITRDDEAQTSAAERFVAHGAWVSVLVLAEATWVLRTVYSLTRKQMALAVEMLLSHEQLVLQDAEIVSSALNEFRRTTKAGFSDCLVLALARAAGHLPVGTFDRSLSKLEGAAATAAATD
jgi:predicted nucleic-acid-binding protein